MCPPRLIVISVDGLRASALGAYGNTWYGTPAIDRFAARGEVYSRCLAVDSDLAELWRLLLGGDGPVGLLNAVATPTGQAVLVTDDQSIASHRASERFGEIILSAPEESAAAAATPTDTASATTLATLVDIVEERRATGPLVAWGHLRFTSGPWDAPLSAVEDLLDEDDPRPEPDVRPAGAALPADNQDDARLLATVRYAAQVIALDACLGVALPALEGAASDGDTTIALVGVRGFALGEHGVVGPDPRPYNECRQSPFIIRRPGDTGHRRRHELFSTADVSRLLCGRSPEVGNASLLLRSPHGAALQDDHWKLYAPASGAAELYSKPDDLWEMNDVAVRHADLVEELAQRLQDGLITFASV